MSTRRPLSDFSAEIEAHITLEADRLRHEEGLSEQDALAAARRHFGNVTQVRERFYERTRQLWLEHLAQDLRFAMRLLTRNPSFAIAAVLTLALGIGANAAIFTAVDALALHPLRFPESERLVAVETRKTQQPEIEPWTAKLDFNDLRNHTKSFSAMAAISPLWQVVMTGHGDTESLDSLFVSSSFFPMLGVQPKIGRDFSPADDQRGARGVAILSHEFWQSHFGGSASILGQTLNLDSGVYTVIGVLPARFHYPGEPVAGTGKDVAVWLPLGANPLDNSPRSLRYLKAIGKLKPGVTKAQAAEEVRRVGDGLANQFPATDRGFEMSLRPLQEQVAGRIRPMSFLLLGAVGLVLAMACASVANLLLVRAAGRRREIFMRVALGASRGRVLIQLLSEGLLLAVCGGVTGVALAYAGLKLLIAAAPASMVHSGEIALDGRALLFTAVLVLASAVLAGLPPAWRILRYEIGAGLRETSHSVAGGHHRWRATLVAGQMAFALTLLVCAGLLLRSFVRLLDVNPGFDTAHVATVATQLPNAARTPEQRTALYKLLEERLMGVAGVRSVAAVSRLPLSGMNLGTWVWIEGRVSSGATSDDDHPDVEYRVATPSYFATMGIPLRAGRLFRESDGANGCLINETMARLLWPGQDPVGRHIKLGLNMQQQPWIEILGVVGDVRHSGIEAAVRPEVYRPYAQNPLGSPRLVVRTDGDPAAVMPALAAAVRSVDPEMPAYNVFSMRELARRSTAQRRFVMTLLMVFALAALVLASVGIYGAASQLVTQRTREIGLRMALGATPAAALRMVMAMGGRLAVAGIAGGALAALALAKSVRGLLFNVSPFDPLVFAAAALVLGVVAMVACLGPALRATRVAPMTALRDE